MIQPPAKNPCGSCPYRCDVPSGVWHPEEYAKLPEYDRPTAEQPPTVFLCHQQNGRLCAGWVACHDMEEALGMRFAASLGMIAPEDFEAIFDYKTDTPLFASGAEAARHGLKDIKKPTPKAKKIVARLLTKKAKQC